MENNQTNGNTEMTITSMIARLRDLTGDRYLLAGQDTADGFHVDHADLRRANPRQMHAFVRTCGDQCRPTDKGLWFTPPARGTE